MLSWIGKVSPQQDRKTEMTQEKGKRSRLHVVAFGSGARIFALGSQFVVLLILSRIMSKDFFGNMMIVFALYRMVSLGIGTGIGNVILFHVGRNGGDEALDVRLHRTATLAASAISILLALVALTLSDEFAAFYDKPGLTLWLVHMSPFLIFSTLNSVAMGSLDGRSRITSSIFITEVVPNGMRLIGLPLIALLHLPPAAAAHIMWLSVAVPWLIAFAPALLSPIRGLQPMTWWDVRYALMFSINTIAGMQLQGLDMLVVGALFSSEQAAGYAITSRLATLYPFFQNILLKIIAPRVGVLLQRAEISTLNAELSTLRAWSAIAVTFLTGAILIAAPVALPLFGTYANESYLLILLAMPALVRSFFPGNDIVLKMSGHAGISMSAALGGEVLLITVPLILKEYIGIAAVPLAMLLAASLFNPFMARFIAYRGVQIVTLSDVPILFLGTAALGITVFIDSAMIAPLAAGVVVMITGVVTGRAVLIKRFSRSL